MILRFAVIAALSASVASPISTTEVARVAPGSPLSAELALTAAVKEVAALPVSMQCPQKRCYNCAFWTATEVKTTLGGFGNQWYEYDCAAVDCPNACVPPQYTALPVKALPRITPTEVDRLWKAVAADDLPAVRRMMQASQEVKINLRREAIQVLGCDGSVVSNIPLRADQLEALAS